MEDGADAAYGRAVAALDHLEGVLAAPLDQARPAPLPVADASLQPDLSWQVAPDDDRFLAAVALAREEIRAGQCFQIVLSRRWSRPSPASPIAIYRALRQVNPSPYMFYLDAGEPRSWALRRRRSCGCDGVAGRGPARSRARGGAGATAPRTRGWPRSCWRDAKERAEHVMLVDLGRNDVGASRASAP